MWKEKTSGRAAPATVFCVLMAIVVIVTTILFCRFIYLSLFAKDMLNGAWTYDGVTTYAFDGKGNGSLILDSASYPFTYVLDESTISIVFENEAVSDIEYAVEVVNDTLLLTTTNTQESCLTFTKVEAGD